MSEKKSGLSRLFGGSRGLGQERSGKTFQTQLIKEVSGQIRLLIVDDLPETRLHIYKLLEGAPDISIIAQAGNGEQAIQMAKRHVPDVILMDINMPGIDGIGACQRITQVVPTSQIIIMSVQSESDYLRRAMLAGARDYLTKPMTRDEMLTAIRRVHIYRPNVASHSLLEAEPAISSLEIEAMLLRRAKLFEQVRLFSRNILEGHMVDELARLTAGIAHDLRSPINLIFNILHTIENLQALPQTIQKYLARIERRVLYCQWLIDNFLGVSFNERLTSKGVRLYDIVIKALSLIKGRYTPSIQVGLHVPTELVVQVDTHLLTLALMNVISNACEAMPDGGKLQIASITERPNIKIFITDTGYGIPVKNRDKIFNVGFTTKPAQCGIGLYVAKRLLRQMYGDIIFFNSNSPTGSKFAISFPIMGKSFAEGFVDPVQDIAQDIIELSNQITAYRAQVLSENDKEIIYQEFRRVTTTFAYNLFNELAIIDATVKEVLLKTKDKNFLQSLRKIARNCRYSQLLVRNMLEIGETVSPKWSLVSLANLIEEVLELLERKMPPEMYRVEWDIDLTLEHIQADETQMKQVFMNLARNALDAMPEGGTLKFEIRSTEDNVVVHVSDSGIGVSAENLSRLFTLGFTTKPEGYGIGLFSIKTIIDKHNGSIKAVSTLGKGTTFIVKLPQRQKG